MGLYSISTAAAPQSMQLMQTSMGLWGRQMGLHPPQTAPNHPPGRIPSTPRHSWLCMQAGQASLSMMLPATRISAGKALPRPNPLDQPASGAAAAEGATDRGRDGEYNLYSGPRPRPGRRRSSSEERRLSGQSPHSMWEHMPIASVPELQVSPRQRVDQSCETGPWTCELLDQWVGTVHANCQPKLP